jgi:hypothetical protein
MFSLLLSLLLSLFLSLLISFMLAIQNFIALFIIFSLLTLFPYHLPLCFPISSLERTSSFPQQDKLISLDEDKKEN